jgi:UDP-N-acetyl-2-amino-2-deoxyglucuronate dehydrogenase
MRYGVVIVGCGQIGTRHAQVVSATEGFELVGVCDIHEGRALELSLAYGVPPMSLEQVLRDPRVSVLALTLPSQLHGEFGLRAIAARKHVIMEKPLATTPDEARKLIGAARHAGLVLAVIAHNRFSDGALMLKAALQRGLLGKVFLARASVRWFRDDPYYTGSDWRGRRGREGGGVLLNQAIHSTDMLIHLLGRPQVAVSLCIQNRGVMDTEDTAVAVLKFPRQVLASMEASVSTWPGFEEVYEVHGDEGHAMLQRGELKEYRTKSRQGPPHVDPQEPSTFPDSKLSLFQRQYRNILTALNLGSDQLLVKPEEALWVVETTQLMYESAWQLSNETFNV